MSDPTEAKQENTKSGILSDYISDEELAEELRVHPRTLKAWRAKGIGPPVTWIGKKPFSYLPSAREWLRSREQRMPRERQHNQARRTA